MKKILIIFLILLFCSNAFSQAPQREPETIADKIGVGETIDKYDFISPFTSKLKDGLKEHKIDLDIFGSILQGFDNNVFLDPSRTKDGFLQSTVAVDAVYNYTNDIRLILNTDVTNISYYTKKDNNLLDLVGNPGFEMDFLDDYLTYIGDYKIEWVLFPHDKDGSYLSNEFSAYIRNNVYKGFYQQGGFKMEYRHYTNRKAYGPSAEPKSDLRDDIRYTGMYEAALYLYDFIKVKETVQFYRNDSNDQFMDYYDYYAFKTRTSLTVLFTDKLYGITSFSYTRKLYDDRLSTEHQTHEKDNLYIFNASVLYELTPSFTLSGGCSYRENTSNEPLEKFSGTIWTVGLYFTF